MACTDYSVKVCEEKEPEVTKKNMPAEVPNAFFNLFDGLEQSGTASEGLTVLANLIDMTYNFCGDEKHHTKHFLPTNIDSIKPNTAGLVACQMFAEYLMAHGKANSFRNALKMIENFQLSDSDKYVGASLAQATWRQSKIYLDNYNAIWNKPFNTTYNDKNTIDKDFVQLRMCAYLLGHITDNGGDVKKMALKPEKEDGNLTRDDFPEVMQTFVEQLKTSQKGGARRSSDKKQTKKRVVVNGKSMVVYVGKRGGEYVKRGGKFVPVSKVVSRS